MMKIIASLLTLVSLFLFSINAQAEVDGGTGAPQEVLSALEWLLSWLPI